MNSDTIKILNFFKNNDDYMDIIYNYLNFKDVINLLKACKFIYKPDSFIHKDIIIITSNEYNDFIKFQNIFIIKSLYILGCNSDCLNKIVFKNNLTYF